MKKRIFLMRPSLAKEDFDQIKKVLRSKFLTEGDVTKRFEAKIASYVHARYAIATTSATTAIHTALECIGIKGKKVLVSDFTFPATALAVRLAGGIPVLADVDKDTMNITTEIAENSLDDYTRVILPVSLFGNPLERDFYKFRRIGINIVEDAATNLGTKIGRDHVGSLADITCFSFHPRKIITTGEGGMITTNDKRVDERCRSYKTFGKVKGEFIQDGTNYKLSDILSALGLAQFSRLEKIITKRLQMAKIYDELLSKISVIEPQKTTVGGRNTRQSYTCYVTKEHLRDKIREKLAHENIESQIGTYALHRLPVFKKCLRKGSLSNSTFLYKNSISLPMHEELSQDDQELICKIIQAASNQQ
ncbi:MAG: DegT/DnrJ/EryC1/StrS aminotransferase family protein [Thaumarchaeota archaeon]|nr:DegT/DnrJ/EryC1/StrS aminotransferase family protein [Nitrososphaerota archaeon]